MGNKKRIRAGIKLLFKLIKSGQVRLDLRKNREYDSGETLLSSSCTGILRDESLNVPGK